jgi:hypothetical protein
LGLRYRKSPSAVKSEMFPPGAMPAGRTDRLSAPEKRVE